MDYSFQGEITSYKTYKIPFKITDGNLCLDVSKLPSHEILFIDSNGNENINGSTAFNQKYLDGITDSGLIIKLHIGNYYDGNWFFDSSNTSTHFIYGNVISCIVLENKKYKGTIDKIGFYSTNISKILGQSFFGNLTMDQLKIMGLDFFLAKYRENDNNYYVTYDFANKNPYVSGLVIAVNSDKPLTHGVMENIYWTMRKFFFFIYQRMEMPLGDIVLYDGDMIIGHFFIHKYIDEKESFFGTKCLQISFIKEHLSDLFQFLVDKKIYLRHLPINEDERNVYSSARFLVTAVGLESTLNTLNIKKPLNEKQLEATRKAKTLIQNAINDSTGKEKQIYKYLLNRIYDKRFEDDVLFALTKHEEFIKEFYGLKKLGKTIQLVAKKIATTRNNFAHGDLKVDLDISLADQCNFLEFLILYLQLVGVGVSEYNASEIVKSFRYGI